MDYFVGRFVLPVIGVLLLLLGLLIRGKGVPWAFPAFNIGLGVFLVFYPLYYRLRLRRCYLRTRTGNGEISVEIGEDGILIDAENARSELNWNAVRFCRKDKNVIMLYLAPAKFITLPKRALNPKQVIELRELLTRKVQTIN
ncbi:MAG: YcxB family protein [Terracidiphilus sp.]